MNRARTRGSGLAMLLALGPACTTAADATRSGASTTTTPVTGICGAGGRLLSCSGDALFDGLVRTDNADAAVERLGFRAFGLTAHIGTDLVVVCGGTPAQSGDLAVYRVAAGSPPQLLQRRRIADDLLYDAAIAPDGETAALACADGRVLVVDLHSLAVRRTPHRHTAPCRAVAFSPDGSRLASAGLDSNLFVSARPAGEPRTLQDHTAGIECLAFSSDGSQLASGAQDGRVRIHDPKGRLTRTYQRLGDPVTALAFDPDHAVFYAGLRNGAVLRLDENRARSEELERFDHPVFCLLARHDGLRVGLAGRCALMFDFAP